MNLFQNSMSKYSDRHKELEVIDINQLKKLHDSIKPENLIKKAIIDNINKKSMDLVLGKKIIIDLELNNFSYLLLAKTIKQFKEAGFKVGYTNMDGNKKLVVKL